MSVATGSMGEGTAVWALLYEIADGDRPEYLAWFHDVHIPEKLGRPGYTWAAHYEVVAGGKIEAGTTGYMAFFGASTTRPLLDPSPAQLKDRQDDLTRRMMGLRRNGRGFVTSEEWRSDGREAARAHAPVVELTLCEAGGNDDPLGAWLVQGCAPVFARQAGCRRMRKLLVAIGPAKHGSLLEFDSAAARDAFEGELARDERTREVRSVCSLKGGTPLVGSRIWPPVG